MNIKTITTVDGVNVVDFGSAASRFYWIENLGSTVVYVSGNENIVPDGDNVKVLSAGCGTMVENLGGKVYILGAGKFHITNQGDKVPPFRNAPVADGGVMASGNPVTLGGLQGGVPFSEMVVSGKNLIVPKSVSRSVNGINFTVNSDKSITINGTSTSGTSFMIGSAVLNKNEKYTLSILSESKGINIHIGSGDDFSNPYDYTVTAKTITAMSEDNTIWIWISANKSFDNVIIYPQLELGDTATAYEPPIAGRELTLSACGKNMNNYSYAFGKTKNGITTTEIDGMLCLNGTIAAKGTCIETSTDFIFKFPQKTGTKICFSKNVVSTGENTTNKSNAGYFEYRNSNFTPVTVNGVRTPEGVVEITDEHIKQDVKYIYYSVFDNAGNVFENHKICAQIEIGDTATAYEPYSGAKYTITPDSNPYIVPNDIRQQDGLNIVSVSEGELSVTGVRKNAAFKRIWDEIDEIKTAIIVYNGETIE